MSDVPTGYKQTEMGVIPEDWEVKFLPEVSWFQEGPGVRNYQFTNSGVKLLNGTNIFRGLLNLDTTTRFISEFEAYGAYRHFLAEAEDIVIASSGITVSKLDEKIAYVMQKDLPFCMNTSTIRLQPLGGLNRRFLFQYLASGSFKRQISGSATGSAQLNFGPSHLNKITIPLPPLPEQRAIASALADVDALLASLENLLTKKRQLKQAAMQELLTGKTRLEGFEGEWEEKQLSEVADVIDPHPSHRAPNEFPGGVPFVGIGDLDESGNLVNPKVRRIHPSVLREHAERYRLTDGLIGLGRVASIGKVVKFPQLGEPFTISPTLGVIRGRQARTEFLFYLLKSEFISDQFNRIMSGSTRASVGMEVLRRLIVKLPRLPEQQAIAAILSDMDAEIDALEGRLTKTRDLKQGMMQELLTGRTRLV